MFHEIVARSSPYKPVDFLQKSFEKVIDKNSVNDALFINTEFDKVVGVSGLPIYVPAVLELLKDEKFAGFVKEVSSEKGSILFKLKNNNVEIYTKNNNSNTIEAYINASSEIASFVLNMLKDSSNWAGEINENGEHIIDLKKPKVGPHFSVNLLMGRRIGFDHALQTTPKSVVDSIGGGSFRSHADTQVLATRWDLRQEENGFPANRQFYLIEDNKIIFYSANAKDPNIKSAKCLHSQNRTKITYETNCGLTVERLIFLLPQYEGLPIATEVQRISVANNSSRQRNIRIVYTGMFGSAAPHALFEDVLYSNIIMQSRILRAEDGSIIAVSPDYYPEKAREDIRFNSMMIRNNGKTVFPKEFTMNYNEFVGNGSLEKPENFNILSNNFYRKGPGFFAVADSFELEPNKTCTIDNFTGLVSKKGSKNFDFVKSFHSEISNLINKFMDEKEVNNAFSDNINFCEKYLGFINLRSKDSDFNVYCNKNLPFQVLYQTFASRSFCQTQKGYREIGFREIQDIYASMYYFLGMGMKDFVKKLIIEWCSKVFEFGFAYHNFYWVGKEPGKCSDDALWLIQAVYKYINMSGDVDFLNEECEIAGTNPIRKRTVYETLKSIIKYSAKISIGKHKMPLLDCSDWNDCLKLDRNSIDGITKEELYRKQLAEKNQNEGVPFESDYSESVMNAFLLKVGIDELISLADRVGDTDYKNEMAELSKEVYCNIQEHAWKGDFFARVLFNRYKNGEFTYLGAKGDGFSTDPQIDGTYFLNSFSWAILADSATEGQIRIMLDTLEKYLVTPYGLKLVSPVNLNKVADDTATEHYFPGDRENGAVFKHATMMATYAMFKAAKEVTDKELARKLTQRAYWMVDLVLPYKTMKNPYVICGNPRFCTQYNNSDTGENIGPMLSGTSTWLLMTIMSFLGIDYTSNGLLIDPILREEDESIEYSLNIDGTILNVLCEKPKGFVRMKDCEYTINVDDGLEKSDNVIKIVDDKKEHFVKIKLG